MKIVRENLVFKRGIDPKESLNIGKRSQIIKWFDKYASNAVYEIRENFGVYVKGNLDLRGASITSLPEGLSVGGSLD